MEAPPPTATATATKLRLMCSYGGEITRRPRTNTLFYAGGDNRIVSIDLRSVTTLSSLLSHLSSALSLSFPFTLKYQLPHLDLHSLAPLSSDQDFHSLIHHHHRHHHHRRIRLFLFPTPLNICYRDSVPEVHLLPPPPLLYHSLYLLPSTLLSTYASLQPQLSFYPIPMNHSQSQSQPQSQNVSPHGQHGNDSNELDNDLARLQIYKSQPPPPPLPSKYVM
ncbi:uncharacterized protein LOC113867553 [Abrus precatorius]|uniref:Uncharacterized protein LOC113867553 n=1 Tax=Abrus precatorius TaxID=3816 RepID=A0A8B8LV20_ABRPR|nr:uncharacterized protein LOC113867553 [Abrus precatorius]